MPALKQPRVAYNVTIILSQYKIIGAVHMHPGQRLSDFINGVKDFVPVTGARVYKLEPEKEISKMSLLEVNVHQILLLYPMEGQVLPSEAEESRENNHITSVEKDDSLNSMYVDPFKGR